MNHPEPGCLIDGEQMTVVAGNLRVYELACDCGMDWHTKDDDGMLLRHAVDGDAGATITLSTGDELTAHQCVEWACETTNDIVNEMNEQAPDGYMYGWCDGSFYYHSDAWWYAS